MCIILCSVRVHSHSRDHIDLCVVVACSIEANQMEDRAMNKMWLVRHLEVTRQLVLEDLRVVKVHHPSCCCPLPPC